MENKEQITGELHTAEGQTNVPAAIATKPGYLTSQFGISSIVIVVSAILGFMGIQQSPEQIGGYLDFAERIAAMLIPFLTILGTVVTYINSRGKIASNTVNANSAVQVASLVGGGPNPLSILGSILGGKNWKDPARYIGIAEAAAPLIPGGGYVTKGLDVVRGGASENKTMEQAFTPTEIETLKKLLAEAGK